MPDRLQSLEGGCMCGAVRYRVEAAPTYAGNCHCDDCRRATGGVYVAWFGARPEDFSITGGALATYASSPGIRRGFCSGCGTSLTFSGEGWNDVAVTIASLDDPNAVTPESNVFLRERLHWVPFAEAMRNWDGFPEAVKEHR